MITKQYEGLVTSNDAALKWAERNLKSKKDNTILLLTFWNGSDYFTKENGRVRWTSNYDPGTGIITIGMDDILNYSELYRMVFIHEYMHHIMTGLGLEDRIWHEALADTYTWYLAKDEQTIQWGADDSGREFPYNLIMVPILNAGEYGCLSKVFTVNVTLDSMINGLNSYCPINTTAIFGSYMPS